MVSLSRKTGRVISDFDHTVESVYTILTTFKQTRQYRRGFGAVLMDKIDSVIDDPLVLEIYGDVIEALKIETRVKVEQVRVSDEQALEGEVLIDIFALYLPGNELITIQGVRII